MSTRQEEQERRKQERVAALLAAEEVAKETNEPVCVEASTHWGISGKVAIVDYGKHSSEYSGSMSRRYVIPPDWTEEQIDEFQLAKRQHLEDLLEPIDQHHYDERIKEANWT